MQKDKHQPVPAAGESQSDDFGPLLPSQYFSDPEFTGHTEAERSLMAAVLIDALRIYEKYVRTHRTRLKRFREVEEWFSENDSDWPYSFINICSELRLKPQTIRDVLMKVRAGETDPLFWRKRLKISGMNPIRAVDEHHDEARRVEGGKAHS